MKKVIPISCAAERFMASVTVFFGGHEQATYPLDKPMIVVGREETCQIYIDNRSISRQHCSFIAREGGFLLQDLNSANGTYVNGHKITEHLLVNEDMVIIGKYELRFNSDAPAASSVASIELSKTAESPRHKPHFDRPPPREVEEPTDAYELWFYAVEGEQKGPVDISMLRRLMRDRAITADTLVWHSGMPDWIPASDAPGVMGPQEPPPLQEAPTPVPSPKAAAPAPRPAPVPAPAPRPAPVAAPQPAPRPAPVPAPPPQSAPAAPAKAAPQPVARIQPVATSADALSFSEAERKAFGELSNYALVWGLILLFVGGYQVYAMLPALEHASSIGLLNAIVLGLSIILPFLVSVLTLMCYGQFSRIKNAAGDDRTNLLAGISSVKQIFRVQVLFVLIIVGVAATVAFLLSRR